MSAAVSLLGVTRRFGGLVAVDDVSLEIAPGERCVVLGPNGAGKTTLFHLITGTIPVSSGRIALIGTDATRLPAHRRARLGIGRTFQITNLFPELGLVENVALACLGRRGGGWAMWRAWWSQASLREEAWHALERVGLADRAGEPVSALSYGERRQLELALALVAEPRIVFLDEPCAGLSQGERQRVADLVHGLPRTITVVLVEHDMDIAFALADRVVVMNRGRLLVDGAPEAIRADARVREVYLGDA